MADDKIRCFFLDETDFYQVSLRRYLWDLPEGQCHHDGEIMLGIEHHAEHPTSGDRGVAHDDPRWPLKCDACGFVFNGVGEWQVNYNMLLQIRGTQERTTFHDAKPGAMWYADWMIHALTKGTRYQGPDGHCLVVRTPGGDWMIDGRANNCGLPNDDEHKCWTRAGDVPNITVSKVYGPTCSAGAGSIVAGSYHGFLRNGILERI
jgi:hypothetical protein